MSGIISLVGRFLVRWGVGGTTQGPLKRKAVPGQSHPKGKSSRVMEEEGGPQECSKQASLGLVLVC